MKIYTIGFTKKSARRFFELIGGTTADRLIDVRLNNVSQLAGFTKRDDLRFFLSELSSLGYFHEPLLAPTQTMLDQYKKRQIGWIEYERQFLSLMAQRQIETVLDSDIVNNSVLLCSEHSPEYCHRRLVAEYFAAHWNDVAIEHL